MRLSDYISIALKDLRRQFIRSSLTIIALVISTVILVIMSAISLGGQRAITDQFGSDDSLTTITVTPNQSAGTLSPFGSVQQVNAGAAKLNDKAVQNLAGLPHVELATPRANIWEFNDFSVGDNSKQFVSQAEGITKNAWLPLRAGSGFASNDEKNVAILGLAYAKELGVSPESLVGKTVRITTQKGYRGVGSDIPGAAASKQENDTFNQSLTTINVRIVGVTDSGADQNGLFIPLGWAREIRTARYAGADGVKTVDQLANDGYSTIQVKVDTKDNVKAVAGDIERLGYGQISTLSQIERLQQFSATMWLILGAVAVTAVIAAALGVVNTMLMAVSEQSYVIGVWRAVGARKSVIVRLFLVESGILGLVGGIIGTAAGVIISRLVNQYVGSLLAAQHLALTSIAVTPLWLTAGTIILTTLFGVIAGMYPAYRAARESPSDALRRSQ